MENDVKILKLLLDRREEIFTIRKISETLKINYRIAHERVAVLEKEGLLKVTKAGNSKICELTHIFNSKVYEAELQRREELFKKNKDFLVIHNRLAELNFVFVALVFGSYAKGNAGKHSDIDILTIGGDEKEIRAAISLLPDKIHLTTISSGDFVHMASSKKFSVVNESLKNNIILIGKGDYYRLLSNARKM